MQNQIQVDGDSNSRLDGLTPQQLVAEIQQIAAQYEQEVPGRRRRWPESIRSRVLALGRLGVTPTKIAGLTDISRATVFLWCRKLPRRTRAESKCEPNASFIELRKSPTVRQDAGSPTVGQCLSNRISKPIESADPDLRIALAAPDGFRFEFIGARAWELARHAYEDLREDSATEGRRP